MKHKRLFISLIAVFTVLIFFFIFFMTWFFGDKYEDFEDFSREIEIPGLDDGAIPQGIGNRYINYTSETENGETLSVYQQYFFISAYMNDGSPSRIYVSGEQSGYVGYVTIKDTDGSYFYGHCGGICTNGTYLWLAGDGTVNVAVADGEYTNIANEIISKAQSRTSAADDLSITFTAKFDANCGADFCFYYDNPRYISTSYDRLYVGEFYRKGNYETDLKHRITTPNGFDNTAFVYEYNVSDTGAYGLARLSATYPDALNDENNVPEIKKIYSITEKIQGLALAGDYLVLSQSYGPANSHILCYDWNAISETSNRVTYSSLWGENFAYSGIVRKSGAPFTVSNLYVYYVDTNSETQFVKDYSIPSMSEGLCSDGDKVYVLFECASKKYRSVVREKVKYVYSIVPSIR